MTGIDIVIEVFKKINTPAIKTLLEGGSVWQHNRPINSPYPDVVISLPVFDGNSRSLNYVDVNVHTPNLENYYPVTGEDQTFPDLAKHKQVVDAVLPLITSGTGYSLQPAIRGVPIRDADGSWYSNIRVSLVSMDEASAHTSELQRMISAPDGFGGVTVNYTTAWSGKAERLTIFDNDQTETDSGRLDFTRRENWRIPATGVAPQKYHRLVNSEGIFTIIGIIPEGDSFWKLLTERKDGPN